jgi:hypothetical protein
MLIKKVGIIANIAKEKSAACTAELRDWMVARGLKVYLEEGIAAKIGAVPGVERGKLGSLVDLLVVFGGDGTILRTARLVQDRDVPIVGINLGVFGYLTEVNLGEMYSALEVILAGEFQIEKRMMLDVEINGGEEPSREGTVLNDVVINRRRPLSHNLQGRRPHRRDADRLDGLFARRGRSDRLSGALFDHHQSDLSPHTHEPADHPSGRGGDQGYAMDLGRGGDRDPRRTGFVYRKVRGYRYHPEIALYHDAGLLPPSGLSGDFENETGVGRFPDGGRKEEARC